MLFYHIPVLSSHESIGFMGEKKKFNAEVAQMSEGLAGNEISEGQEKFPFLKAFSGLYQDSEPGEQGVFPSTSDFCENVRLHELSISAFNPPAKPASFISKYILKYDYSYPLPPPCSKELIFSFTQVQTNWFLCPHCCALIAISHKIAKDIISVFLISPNNFSYPYEERETTVLILSQNFCICYSIRLE